MTLSEYLKLHDITDGDFADLVKRDRTTVLRWRKGETRPDWEGLEAILSVTNNVVRPDDFLLSPDDLAPSSENPSIEAIA